MTHKQSFLKCWIFILRAKRFSCSLDIRKLQFLIKSFFFPSIFNHQNPGSGSRFTWNTGSRSGSTAQIIYIGTYLSVAPLDSLQAQLLQEDPLGLLLALLEQLAHKLPVGLGNARLAGGEHGDLLARHQVQIAEEDAGSPVPADKDSCAAAHTENRSHNRLLIR